MTGAEDDQASAAVPFAVMRRKLILPQSGRTFPPRSALSASEWLQWKLPIDQDSAHTLLRISEIGDRFRSGWQGQSQW